MQKKCPKCKCKNKDIKLNWKNDKWKQKYKCKKCNFCFIRKDRKSDKSRWTRFFDNRLKEWYSIRQLSNQYWKNNCL